MKQLTRPAWLEIDLDKLVHNYNEIRNILDKDTELMGIVKADAYEHGAEYIVKTLMQCGVKKYGVAHLSEALHIKKHIKDAAILVMGYIPDYLLEKAVENDITVTLYNKKQGYALSEISKKLSKTTKAHIKIETGMNRLGFMPTIESVTEIKDIYHMENIILEGVFTHFPASDDNFDYTEKQVEKFEFMIVELEKSGVNFPIKHVCNSAAIMNFKKFYYNMVRAGIILYGVYPYPKADKNLIKLENICSLKAQISNVKTIGKGEKISYGLAYETTKETKVATVPIGYADGYSRLLSNIGHCIVKGTILPIIGRICMDQLMLDVTGIDVKIGDEVVLIGKQGNKEITIEEVAEQSGQIPAAVMCSFTKRLPRVYMKNGEIYEVVDYLLKI